MTAQINWRTSALANHLYATAAVGLGWPVVDASIQAGLNECSSRFEACGIAPMRLMLQGVALAGMTDDVAQLTRDWQAVDEPALSQATKWESVGTILKSTHEFGDDLFPNVVDELRLRMRPLREQWEARGPGLMMAMQRHLPAAEAREVSIYLTLPICGGGGFAHCGFDAITVEAVLVNPLADVPEIVRMAWLLTQMDIVGGLPNDERVQAPPIALGAVPVILAAAADVDLVNFTPRTVTQALEAWLRVPKAAQLADRLLGWWSDNADSLKSSTVTWLEAMQSLPTRSEQ